MRNEMRTREERVAVRGCGSEVFQEKKRLIAKYLLTCPIVPLL